MLPSTTLLPRGETLFHLHLIKILEMFKDFFACKLVSAANHQHPENIRRLFRLQICLSCKSSISWKYSKTLSSASSIQAAAIIQQAVSQQQPAIIQQAVFQPQPAISSNQQQQSTAATSSPNHHQQATATTSFRPTSSTYTINAGIC